MTGQSNESKPLQPSEQDASKPAFFVKSDAPKTFGQAIKMVLNLWLNLFV